VSVELIEHRLTAVESALTKVAQAIEDIAASTRLIAHLELKHAETRESLERAFAEIVKLQSADNLLDTRMRVVEIEMPALHTTRRTVDNAIFGIVGMVGVALIGLVILH
jgi:chromosome segregation ATPase